MPSTSLASLRDGLNEVEDLQRANPTPTGSMPRQPEITQAIDRASVVMLSGHLEGYIYDINVEAAAVVNNSAIYSTRLPQVLRLVHSKPALEDLAATGWETDSRARKLETFVTLESWLWHASTGGQLVAERLLFWMKTPKPDALRRYYRYWGIEDIFATITRTASVRGNLWLRIQELVEKRNSIAHGDKSVAATQSDVDSYAKAVWTFAERADRALAAQLARVCQCPRPW